MQPDTRVALCTQTTRCQHRGREKASEWSIGEAEEDNDILENEEGNNSGKASGGGRGWQVQKKKLDIGAVALITLPLPQYLLHSVVKDREQREEKDGEQMEGAVTDGWWTDGRH